MQLIDSCVSFLEVKVVTIRYARIIAHPLTDFRQALSGNCEKGAKRMAHDVRRDPRKILLKFLAHKFQTGAGDETRTRDLSRARYCARRC